MNITIMPLFQNIPTIPGKNDSNYFPNNICIFFIVIALEVNSLATDIFS